jgi:hypothetical protein
MKINQLFKSLIPEDLFKSICECYGITNFITEYSFSKKEMDKMKTLENLNNYKDDLNQYYLPCKAKLYLNNLNHSKAITILRQILRLYNMTLLSKQKYIKQKKTTLYYISKISDNVIDINTMKVDNHSITLIFS